MFGFKDFIFHVFFYHFRRFHKVFFVLIYFILLGNAKNYECAFKETLKTGTNDTSITCEMRDVKYDELDNFNMTMNKTDVEMLKFKSSKISTIPYLLFNIFPKLKVFDASDVGLKHINSLSFNNAEHLLEIFMQNNRLTSIVGYVFVHTKKLKILDLSNNNIAKILNFAFNSLHDLEKLSLSNNRIESFEEDTFLPLVNLEWIWLDRNHLKMISSDLFKKTNAKLEGILLDNNEIELISPHVFDNLSKLRFLSLNNNKCINQSFKNHVVENNAGIKFELRTCHSNYRKIESINDDTRFNVTLTLLKLGTNYGTCMNETANLQNALLKIQLQISKLLKDNA